jgi:hypothetical protein
VIDTGFGVNQSLNKLEGDSSLETPTYKLGFVPEHLVLLDVEAPSTQAFHS